MASYIPQVQGTGYDVVKPYQADYSFLSGLLDKKEGQYQQGLAEVQQGYSAITNEPVTGEAMKQVQQQYIKTAQEGLKKLSTTDLSLPKNVAQAEALYAPFWQDQGLLTNTAITKFGNNNIQRVQSGLFSKDDDVRNMYDPIQMQDQQGMLNDLAAAGTDLNAIKAVEQRQLVPFRNIKNDLNELATKQKLEIKWDHPDGPYIVSTINGTSSVPNFKTWANANVGSEYNAQFNVYGRVAYDHAKSLARQINPGISDSELNATIAKSTVQEELKQYQTNIAEHTTASTRLDKKIDDVLNRGVVVQGVRQPSPNDEELYRQLQQQRASFNLYGNELLREYQDFKDEGAKRDYTGIVANPAQAFAKMQRDHIINNFAAAQSANESRTIKENTVFSHAVTEHRLNRDLDFQINKEHNKEVQDQKDYDLRVRNQQYLEAKEGVKFDPATGTFTGGASGVGSDPTSAVRTGTPDVDATAFLHEVNPYQRVTEDLNNQFTSAINDLFSTNGAAQALINAPITVDGQATTLSVADIDKANSAILKKSSNEKYNYSPEEQVAVKKMATAIGAKDPNNVVDMQQALTNKLGQEELDKGGIPTIQSVKTAQMVMRSNETLEHVKAYRQQIQSAVQLHVLSNPKEYGSLIVTGKDGKPTMATSELMAPDFPTLYLTDETGAQKIISPEQYAQMYIANKLQSPISLMGTGESGAKFFEMDGHTYYTNSMSMKHPDGSNYHPKEFREINDWSQNITKKYDKINELYPRAQNAVMSSIPEYNATTGTRGMQLGYNDNNPEQRPVLNAISNALSVASNNGGVIVDGKLVTEPKDIEAINNVLKAGNKFIQAIEYKPFGGTDGGPAVRVTFKPEAENNKMMIGTKKLTEYSKQGSIIVNIDRKTQNPVLQSLMNAGGNTMYSDMISSGKQYKSNNVQDAHNFHYEIQPTGKDAQGHYTGAVIVLTTKVINPETGKAETTYPFLQSRYQDKYPTISFSKQTPYQIRSMIDQYYMDYLRTNISNYQQYRKKAQNAVDFHTLETAQ